MAGKDDPLLAALIDKLPPAGTKWSMDERRAWVSMLEMAFQVVYGATEDRGRELRPEVVSAIEAEARLRMMPAAEVVATLPNDSGLKFVIDAAGHARRSDGKPILPGDIPPHEVLYDSRGEMGDLSAIIWANGARGVPRDFPIEIAAAA